jgi:hypothetical protein
MKKTSCLLAQVTAAFLLAGLCGKFAVAADAPAPVQRTVIAGGTVPAAASAARSVILTPAAGGLSTAVPLAADGSFKATGLSAGEYVLKVVSVTVTKQTQGATFGEKVNQGLHAAGGVVSQGAKQGATPNSMPNRISMNVTVGKRTMPLDVDGGGSPVTVGADGSLAGVAKTP